MMVTHPVMSAVLLSSANPNKSDLTVKLIIIIIFITECRGTILFYYNNYYYFITECRGTTLFYYYNNYHFHHRMPWNDIILL